MDTYALSGTWPVPRSAFQTSGTEPLVAGRGAADFSVLLVDDNAVNRLSLSRWLEKKGGYRVTLAGDGAEALRRVEEEAFDLLVLDVMMPVMGGFEVLRRLREVYTPEELPIVIATSRDQSDDVVEAFNLGANDYIVKPIDYPVALARVRAQLRSRSRHREPPRRISTVSPLHEIRAGIVLEGKYRLDAMIGAGSHGAVFRATHLNLNREVAIKVLHAGLLDDDEALEKFQHEGISACRLDHPNAVTVLDFTATENGLVFLVMELLRGHSLQEELRLEGKLSPERAAQILFPICDALTEAHSLGIIHRDIKPQNTFLHRSKRGEQVKVLDFGLATLLEDSAESKEPTLDGIAGTLAYIAPERVTAEPYDGRADVYSLGIMLYEMLTGQLPFVDQTSHPVQMMMMHVRRPPPLLREWVPDLDPEVENVVLDALEKNPRKRPSAKELKENLARVLHLLPTSQEEGFSEQSGAILRKMLEQEMSKELSQWRKRREQRQKRGGQNCERLGSSGIC